MTGTIETRCLHNYSAIIYVLATDEGGRESATRQLPHAVAAGHRAHRRDADLPAGTSIAMPGDLAVAQVALPQAVPCRGRDSPSENGRTVGAGRVTNVSP